MFTVTLSLENRKRNIIVRNERNEMEKRKEECKERTRIKRMGWRKERKNTRKGQGEEE